MTSPFAPSSHGQTEAQGLPPGGTRSTHPLAVASTVVSLMPCCGLNSPIAIGLGWYALTKIRRSPHLYTGTGWAKAGMVIGGLGVLFVLGFVGFLKTEFDDVRPVCARAVRVVAEGDRGAALKVLSPEMQSADYLPELEETLRELGPLRELGWGTEIRVVNDQTHVTFSGEFEKGEAEVHCSLEREPRYRVTALGVVVD